MTREEKLQNEWLKDNKPKKIVPTKELAVNKIVDLDEKKISTKFNNQIEYKSDDKEENEYLNKITDEDIQILKTFQDKFINDLKIKESEWIEKKADIQDMYFCVDSEIKNTKFKNRIIEGIERHRLSEYLKKERGLGREILNLGIFLENLSVNDDTRYWLFKKSKKYEKIRESLYSIIVQIFDNKTIYNKFIENTFLSIILKNSDNMYNSFLSLLELYFAFLNLSFQMKSKYAILITELLFDVEVKEKKAPDKLEIIGTKFGVAKIKYQRKSSHKKSK